MPETAAGRMDAMGRLSSLIVVPGLSSLYRLQDPFEREDYGLPPDALAVAREAPGGACRRAAQRPGKTHGTDGLLRAAAPRARDAGDRDGHRSLAAFQRAARHFTGRLLAYGAAATQRFRPHPEQLLLRGVGIGDETTIEPGRRTRHRGHHLRDPSAGARFCGSEDRARSPQPLP